MRSYYEHLKTFVPPTQTAIVPKPILRSSAIFPVLRFSGIHSRLLFMGYWILKRNIQQIAAIYTLRTVKGEILSRSQLMITESKTYRIELDDILKEINVPEEENFHGSLEIEFFSTVNLVFPFPAVVINYYGPKFCTVVHTAQRIYNDFDDMQRNSQTQVPESGFNLYADANREPFLSLINGPLAVENCPLHLEFFNLEQEQMNLDLELGRLEPYETRFIYPAQELDLHTFLKGKPGTGKARFKVNWIFPRLVVGNIQRNLPGISITHTYYDCADAKADSDYWRPSEENWYPATLMVPASLLDSHFTYVYFYPIYSPSHFKIDVELYSSQGELLVMHQNVLDIKAPYCSLQRIDMKHLCELAGLTPKGAMAARLIAKTPDGQRLPSRIKIGLDIGETPEALPCNICTNLQPFNPDQETKPRAFRWGPILADQPDASLWVMNSGPHIHYDRISELDLTFFREKDTQTLNRKFTLAPHGFVAIYVKNDRELQHFFEGKVGWFTAVTTNPYTSTYYFAENPSGMLGGDHGF
jgi:hypothetical protein